MNKFRWKNLFNVTLQILNILTCLWVHFFSLLLFFPFPLFFLFVKNKSQYSILSTKKNQQSMPLERGRKKNEKISRSLKQIISFVIFQFKSLCIVVLKCIDWYQFICLLEFEVVRIAWGSWLIETLVIFWHWNHIFQRTKEKGK